MKYLKYGLMLIVVVVVSSCESCKRDLRTIRSEFTGGLDRECVVYSYDGEVLAEYSGRFDLVFQETSVFFDVNGKRTIIVGGTIVCDEN